MDGGRFDQLAKGLAAGMPRRRLVKSLAGGVVAGMMALMGRSGADAEQVTQAYCGNKVCAKDPSVCNDGCVCCAFGNGNSRCMPPSSCRRLGGTGCPAGQTTCNGECCDGDCVNGSCQSICSPNDDHCTFISAPCNDDSACACYDTIDGAFACFHQTSCSGMESCAHDSDCPAGSACVFNYCCDQAGSCVSFCPSGSSITSFAASGGVVGQQHNQP